MSLVDPLSDALVNIKNSEAASKKFCVLRPASKLLGEVLKVMKANGFVGDWEFVEDGRDGFYRVSLLGQINKCSAIKPRYAIGKNEFEKYEKRYLPARDIGLLIVTTSNGVLTHRGAKEKSIGGRLLAFVY